MRERGDMRCFHEPFMYDYYVHRNVRRMPYFQVQEEHPVAYPQIRQMLVDAADNQPVFFKDMPYYIVPQILNDTNFQQRLTHVFLIRDLKAAIVSYFTLDSHVTCEEIGLEAQFRLFDKIRNAGLPTLVVRAESFRKNLDHTLEQLYSHVALSPVAEQCASPARWQQPVAEDWQQVGVWHTEIMNSIGIKPHDNNLEAEENNRSQRAYENACSDNPHLKYYYEHHLPYYTQLLQVAV